MKRVTGIGGVFFKTPDPEATRAWYAKHLGFEVDAYGASFAWQSESNPSGKGHTAWSPFKEDTDYFGNQNFMINYRVDDLEKLIVLLVAEGVEIVSELQKEDYGKFIHILDLNGLRLELWEPIDEVYDEMTSAKTKS
ncbi:MAG: catechol 2,3-dioxygenase-like lactoylglutathione lyase family enzyme [Flavobacteriales bacterium]|jgi:catechol 2,3-dioxygenase-like lactoylglutathione lyase family enzyme